MYRNKRVKDTKTIVKDIFIEHREWNAAQIYERYKAIVNPENWVSLNAIQKHVEELRRAVLSIKEEDPFLDAPFDLGTFIIKYGQGIESEAISCILVVLRQVETIPQIMFSNRQARWMAKLFHPINTFIMKEGLDFTLYPVILALISSLYTRLEYDSKISNIPLNTQLVDRVFYSEKPLETFIEIMASVYENDANENHKAAQEFIIEMLAKNKKGR